MYNDKHKGAQIVRLMFEVRRSFWNMSYVYHFKGRPTTFPWLVVK